MQSRERSAAGQIRGAGIQDVSHSCPTEIRRVKEEINSGRTMLERISNIMKQMNGPGCPNPGIAQGVVPNGIDMIPMSTSPVPHQRVVGATPNRSQAWLQQPSSSSPAHQFSSPRPTTNGHIMSNDNPQQPNMQTATPQLPPQMLANQHNQHMQRTATTPLPQGLNAGLAPPGPQPVQNGITNGFPNVSMGAPGGQRGQRAQPCQQQQAQRDQQMQLLQQLQLLTGFNWLPKNPKDKLLLKYENRAIDLYQLHYELTASEGHAKRPKAIHWCETSVCQYTRLRHEARQSWPRARNRVANIYKEFLSVFDRHYTGSMARQYQQTKQQMGVGNMENGAQVPNQSAGPSAPPAAGPTGGVQALNSLRPLAEIRDSQLMGETISYSIIPTAELERRNAPQHVIELVGRSRDQLRNMFEQQRAFRTHLAQNSQKLAVCASSNLPHRHQ
ncbi:hypothetical protein C8Q73DRAFT_793030 [Cubamyces lactineus]|nr:hypothetical protein C8Q73DRAFT_793030 [Cubamyces lactineus]